MALSRRELLRTGLGGGLGLATPWLAWSELIERAAEAAPAPGTGFQAIDHIVVLVQENRSFDHYFGTLRGIRGFADAARQPLGDGSGLSVLAQPGYPVPGYGGRLYPFHLDTASGHGECVADPDHSWGVQHRSWDRGAMDSFVRQHVAADGTNAGAITMGYYGRTDAAFYYALADAFTICDSYFCSVLGPSYPNHAYMISGTLDPDGRNGGPLLAGGNPGQFSWTTMPEQLQARGVEWKVYTSPDNYAPGQVGDPIFQLFSQYLTRPDLAQRAFGPQYPSDFVRDAQSGQLPAVSWVYVPIAQSEHPPGPLAFGESAAASILDALTSNQAAWLRTALFITWDENGGFFDHVAPPTPPPGTSGEHIGVRPLPPAAEGLGDPIGLGFRVPMLVVSPFSRGGFVCSEVFDHTSLLRFIEARFGVEAPNLSAWRRTAVGDLRSAFDFSARDPSVPSLPSVSLTPVVTGDCAVSVVNGEVKTLPIGNYPVPPNSIPEQEPGTRPRRPLPSTPSGRAPGRSPVPAPRAPSTRRRRRRRRHHRRRHHRHRHHHRRRNRHHRRRARRRDRDDG